MPANPDFKDLLRSLNDEKVEYLIVGAHAVVFYAEPRFTKDLDVWVNPTPENARRVFEALGKFGAPLAKVSLEDFCDPDNVFQIGLPPNRIDILMGITGMDFHTAWNRRVNSAYDGEPIHFIGKSELIRNKKALGRPQDKIDLENLEKEDSET